MLKSYLIILNLAAFLLCGLDKRKAVRGRWRIPEKTLLLAAAFGGSAGLLCGMYLFRHKTRHKAFTIGVPLILAVQIGAVAWVMMQ